ncbi:MAG: FAD-binding protein [Chloroflexi bacterium]|nr:MAG: FAD-binding protein [Chloroflexota bacterium]TME99648.1 MAG: FAD-binding protein [Chloroflexota bacterium]
MTAVVVIGGGIAGYCAAIGARREGAEVTMIAKAPGATALYAGAMEVVDDLEALLKNEQHHPFSRLRMDPVRLSTELDTAVPALLLALEKDGLKVEGGWRTRGAYADIHGLARPGNIVPATVAGGELKGLVGRRVTVVGVREVGDYDAASTAQALKELHNVEAIPEEVSITELPAGAALTDLYGRRAPSVTNTRALVAYPPGFSTLPDGGFELLASPPSPHGWRLQQAIGLGAVRAEVDGVQVDGARIVAVKAGEKTFRANAFVLATGHYIGGGLRKDGATSEPLLNLGVFHDGKAVATLGTRLEHMDYLEPAQEFRSGLSTDERLRPLDEAGRAPFENLFAAGSVLGGYDYAGPCGFGVPILTGWLAGRFAARFGR